jgi:hypothetical protein
MSTLPNSSTPFQREIRYDRTSRDYALYLDGELVGYACDPHQGARTLDALVYERLTHRVACSAVEDEAQPTNTAA